MTNEGYHNLVAAIVESAVRDYMRALRILRKNPNNIAAVELCISCERFFLHELSFYSDLDGKTIIRRVREKVADENRRKTSKRAANNAV